MSMAKIRTPLRYPGGKFRALKTILAEIPQSFTSYREPFLGGGSVFFAIKQLLGEKVEKYWLNDLNYDLYCFWWYAQKDIDQLVDRVSEVKKMQLDGRYLYQELIQGDSELNDFARAVRFFLLNRITFSGTVESGGYSQQAFEKRFTDSSIQRLKAISKALVDVKITNLDYESVIHAPGEGVFIFLDPPYWIATKSKLYGKKGDLHTNFDHDRFADNMKKCSHQWLITYDDSPKIRELFDFANIVEWDLQYGMNNYKQGKAAKGKELMIKNY